MDAVFFEKQEGALCAQHALNALLQGPYFTAVDLATIATNLDAEERAVLREGGVDNPDYLRSLQQDSHNMDDTGYFSVQVISAALRVWNLRLVPFTADEPVACSARIDPASQNAYICNFREHWFTIRRFASQQWLNLNSLLDGPEPVSTTYLHLFLSQLQRDGYSIFVVDGALPQCQADAELLLHPISQTARSGVATSGQADEDPELAAAVALSLGQSAGSRASADYRPSTPDVEMAEALKESARQLDEDDASLKEAMARSLAEQDDEDLRMALMLSMETANGETSSQPATSYAAAAVPKGESIRPTVPPGAAEVPNPADLRAKRSAFLDRLQKTQDAKEKEDKK